MADTFNDKLDLPVSIRRTNAIPLDDRFQFGSAGELDDYLQQADCNAYDGQIVYVRDSNRYYTITVEGSVPDCRPILNTQDIQFIDPEAATKNDQIRSNTIPAKTKLNTKHSWRRVDSETLIPWYPDDRELFYHKEIDGNNTQLWTQLQIGTGNDSEPQILSPRWDDDNAIFTGDVKANSFTIGDTHLTEEDFGLFNSITPYELLEFKVNVFDASDTSIEELNFNFRDDSTWEEWSLANTSAGFRCVKVLDADSNLKSYVRYKNSFLVYSDADTTTQVSPDAKITDDGTYYCKPADATGPITNITFDADTNTLSWTNPVVDTLHQPINGIRILYRTDRYPENESDVMYVLNGESYEIAASNLTGIVDINSTEMCESGKNCTFDLTTITALEPGKLYYFYVTPCTGNGFYTESNRQRCLVFIPEAVAASISEEHVANTSNTALETLLGV